MYDTLRHISLTWKVKLPVLSNLRSCSFVFCNDCAAFLLHIPEYWAALLFSEIEYWIEAFYFPRLKKILSPYLFPVGLLSINLSLHLFCECSSHAAGVVMIIAGSLIRKGSVPLSPPPSLPPSS
jgi:hypothetical protein